jgi:hypothetical protein
MQVSLDQLTIPQEDRQTNYDRIAAATALAIREKCPYYVILKGTLGECTVVLLMQREK